MEVYQLLKKVILFVNWKSLIICLTVGLIKKTVKITEYFLKPKSLGPNVKVELDLSNYATKADL